MKIILILILSMIFFMSNTRRHFRFHHSHKERSHMQRHKTITPKGNGLSNHFGLSLMTSPYGPKQTTDVKNMILTDNYGRMSMPFKQMNSQLSNANNCDIHQNSYYGFCSSISSCNQCISSNNCGWCSGNCLPNAVSTDPSCTNLCSSFSTSLSECSNEVVFGTMQNVAPDATKIISPELAKPKTIEVNHIYDLGVKDTKIPIGSKEDIIEVAAHSKADNQIKNMYFKYDKPIYTTIQTPSIEYKKEIKAFDSATGENLIKEQEKIYHGTKKNLKKTAKRIKRKH